MTKTNPERTSLSKAGETMGELRSVLTSAVLGQAEVVDLVLTCLFGGGHLLLEDHPGTGKTLLAKSLGMAIEPSGGQSTSAFRRIQFTPDLLPSDITGYNMFDQRNATFVFRPGPLFANIVLADEINRTPPKVQAALLEAMAEHQVTVDNVTYKLDDLFLVIATQNAREKAGIYPLPFVQLDRFAVRCQMSPLNSEDEIEVLRRQRMDGPRVLGKKTKRTDILDARYAIDRGVSVSPHIERCVVEIGQASRAHGAVSRGLSTRALASTMPLLRCSAALRGRDYVSTGDLTSVLPFAFSHRIEMASSDASAEAVVAECMKEPLEKVNRLV